MKKNIKDFVFISLLIAAVPLFLWHIRDLIGVDKISPLCFRGSRYGACGYYKEFFDPAHHKTPTPFSKLEVQNEVISRPSVERKNFDNWQWMVIWEGRLPKKAGTVFTDKSRRAAFPPGCNRDDSSLIPSNEEELPAVSQSFYQKDTVIQKYGIKKKCYFYNMYKNMYSITLLIFILFFVFVVFQNLELRGVCKRLDEWKLFVNTTNCGFCLKQLEYLGNNAKFMNVLHCDDKKNVRECCNLEGLPMWVKGNKKLPGARLSLSSLKKLL